MGSANHAEDQKVLLDSFGEKGILNPQGSAWVMVILTEVVTVKKSRAFCKALHHQQHP